MGKWDFYEQKKSQEEKYSNHGMHRHSHIHREMGGKERWVDGNL